MTDALIGHPVITTADGVPLKVKLRRTTRINRIKALLLVTPLFAFILVTFVFPIASMLFRSIDNPVLVELMPKTVAAMENWDGEGIPGEAVFAALAEELVARRADQTVGKIGIRLNYEMAGMKSLITKTARKLKRIDHGPWREAVIGINSRWADPQVWGIIRNTAKPLTINYYLAALDLMEKADGEIVSVPENERIYVMLFMRTLWVSLFITFLCLLLGYPIAYLLATLPVRISNLLLILVLLPFWTSLLVRTTSWIVLLQAQGVINDILVLSGLISEDGRIQMIYNMTGTIVAMTHILLPYMVLPLYSVMKTISPSYVRAAQSLGANPATAFWRVYFPQSVPGIGAGSLLVFILAVGYYITPALVGGRTGQLISNFIAYHMQKSLNWGLAAALGGLLLGGVLVLYWFYNRIVGIDKMKLG